MKTIFKLTFLFFFLFPTLSFSTTLTGENNSTWAYKKNSNTDNSQFDNLNKDANAFEITLKNRDLELIDISSALNCSNGSFDISGSTGLNNPEKLFSDFIDHLVNDPKQMLQEMALQEGVESIIDGVALIHYIIVKKSASDVSFSQILGAKEFSACMSESIKESFKTEADMGVAIESKHPFELQMGINVVPLLKSTKCIRKLLDMEGGVEDKEQFKKSKKWARHMFYKILNAASDFNFKASLPDECADLKKEASSGNFSLSLATSGSKMIMLDGGKILNSTSYFVKSTHLKMDTLQPQKKGTTNEPTNEPDIKTEDPIKTEATSQTEIDSSDSEEGTGNSKKLLQKYKYIEETVFTSSHKSIPNTNVIDITDFSEEEVKLFNLSFFKNNVLPTLTDFRKENPSLRAEISKGIEEASWRLLTLTKDNKYMKDIHKKCSEGDLSECTTFKSLLLDKASIYNTKATTGISPLSLISKLDDKNKALPIADFIKVSNKQLIKDSSLERLLFFEKRAFIAGGESLFNANATNVKLSKHIAKSSPTNQYNTIDYWLLQKDLASSYDLMKDLLALYNNNATNINPNIIIKSPLSEFEYARYFYFFADPLSLEIFLNQKPGEIIKKLYGTDEINIQISKYSDFYSKNVTYSVEELRLMSFFISKLKEQYINNLLLKLLERAPIVQNFLNQHLTSNTEFVDIEKLSSFRLSQVKKFELHQKQKLALLKLLMD
jgi:hypothetical protein